MHESRKSVSNTGATPLRVWLEPWADEVVIPPGETFVFVGFGAEAGESEVEEWDQGLVIYSWPSARLTVYHRGEVVWQDFGIPVPPLPEGMSTSSFVKAAFHDEASRQHTRRKPWWKLW